MATRTRASSRLRAGVEEAQKPTKPTSKQVAVPQRRATRQTRPKAVATEAELPISSPKQPRVQSRSHRDNSIARRSAKQPVDAKSVASIATVHQSGSEYSEASEEDDSEEADEDAIVAQLEIHPRGSEEATAFDQDTLNADIMVKSRQYLYVAARDLYEHLYLEDGGPAWDDLLRALRDVFNRWNAHYPTGRTPFLDRELIDKILEDRETQVPVVSHIVSAANLVILLDSVHQVATGEEDPLRLFEKIDEDFPRCIMAPDSATAASYEEHGTFKRALNIRISRWVLQILATENCTPEVAMEIGARLIFGEPGDYMVFPAEKDSGNIKFRSIYGVEFDNPNDKDEARMRKDICRDFDRVRQIILSDGGFDPEGLRQAFPIDKDLDELSRWAESLFGEVVKTIELESARPRISGRAEATEGQSSKSLHKGTNSVQFLQRLRDSSSGKRRRDEDTGEGDVFEIAASPAHKKPRSRVPRARTTQGAERTRAEHEDTEDAPRGTRGTAERLPHSAVSETPPHKQRQPQRRIPWDKHDEKVLEHWVKVHGSFWSHMEGMALGLKPGGELLHVKRTQQQFRDKARNMKLDMLRNDRLLPENFDGVWLGPKEKDLLKKLGKNPYRREDDVEAGQPVNTEYISSDDE